MILWQNSRGLLGPEVSEDLVGSIRARISGHLQPTHGSQLSMRLELFQKLHQLPTWALDTTCMGSDACKSCIDSVACAGDRSHRCAAFCVHVENDQSCDCLIHKITEALDPEFGGAAEEKNIDLLEASVDFVAWIHSQIGVPSHHDPSAAQPSGGGGSEPEPASLQAGSRGSFCPWTARMAAWTELQILRILAAAARSKSVVKSPELQRKLLEESVAAVNHLGEVLESTLEWLQAHAFRTLTSYTAEGTAGWLPQMLLPHAPGFWHDEDADEADAHMANAMTRIDVACMVHTAIHIAFLDSPKVLEASVKDPKCPVQEICEKFTDSPDSSVRTAALAMHQSVIKCMIRMRDMLCSDQLGLWAMARRFSASYGHARMLHMPSSGAQDRSLRVWLLALTVLMHCATPATAAVRRCVRQTEALLRSKPEIDAHVAVPEWEVLCEHITAFSSSAVLVLHAYMHGAAASSLDEPPLTWRVLWTAQHVQSTQHGVLERVQGATVYPGSWVFEPVLSDGVFEGVASDSPGLKGASLSLQWGTVQLQRIRKSDLGNLKWICERLVLLSWEQIIRKWAAVQLLDLPPKTLSEQRLRNRESGESEDQEVDETVFRMFHSAANANARLQQINALCLRLQAAAAHGAMHGPIHLNITPLCHVESLPVQDLTDQNQAISDYVISHGGSLLTSRLQLIPVEAGMHCISTAFTKVVPFYLSFKPQDDVIEDPAASIGGSGGDNMVVAVKIKKPHIDDDVPYPYQRPWVSKCRADYHALRKCRDARQFRDMHGRIDLRSVHACDIMHVFGALVSPQNLLQEFEGVSHHPLDEGKFQKVSIVMPWMHLDTLQSFIPGNAIHGAYASVPQAQTLESIDSVLLLCENTISASSQSTPDVDRNQRRKSKVMAKIQEMVDQSVEPVVTARGLEDAWEACTFLEQFRERLRKLITWAALKLCIEWNDTWDAAGTENQQAQACATINVHEMHALLKVLHACSWRMTVSTLLGVLQSVAKVHSLGISHGDIAPRNVFVANSGKPVLGDFDYGVVRELNPSTVSWKKKKVSTSAVATGAHVSPSVSDSLPVSISQSNLQASPQNISQDPGQPQSELEAIMRHMHVSNDVAHPHQHELAGIPFWQKPPEIHALDMDKKSDSCGMHAAHVLRRPPQQIATDEMDAYHNALHAADAYMCGLLGVQLCTRMQLNHAMVQWLQVSHDCPHACSELLAKVEASRLRPATYAKQDTPDWWSKSGGGWERLRTILCNLLHSSPDQRCSAAEASRSLHSLLEDMKAHQVL